VLPSLSIVIPSHGRPDLLRACLLTVTRHAPASTEIVVIDDGSPGQVAHSVAAAFPSVRTISLARQRGFCVAANRGIFETTGSVVELLNDDTEVTSGWAESALGAFQDPSVAAVAPLVLYPPGDAPVTSPPLIDSAGDHYYVGGIAGKRGHRRPLEATYLRRCRVFGASASSAFFRRAALLEVGAFPESFGAYFEDVDLAFRLHWAGYHIVYQPDSRVLHHVSASYGRSKRRLLEQQSCNEERVFWRNLPARELARALPRHLAVLAGKAWRRWREGNLSPFLWGRLRLLGEIKSLLEHRSQLRRLGPADHFRHWQISGAW
jgi:GT2 family glycosyltransferase